MELDSELTPVYLDFVLERHRIWERRFAGEPGPWTTDPILQAYRFTNVYRVLDYGSQFLLQEILRDALDPRTALARIMLWRMSGWPALWIYTHRMLGRYPTPEDMAGPLADIWSEYRDNGGQIFSPAYMIVGGPGKVGVDKTRWVVDLIGGVFDGRHYDGDIIEDLAREDMAGRTEVLGRIYRIGRFMQMQILTDWGYTSFGRDQDENAFILPGPGAVKGGRFLASGENTVAIISECRSRLLAEPDCPTLFGRPPSLMDVQNTLCEFKKYMFVRAAGEIRFGRARAYSTTPRYGHRPLRAPAMLPTHWLAAQYASGEGAAGA